MLRQKEKQEKSKTKGIKFGAISEIILMILSSFAFAFIIGMAFTSSIPEVEAEPTSNPVVPQGCCLETNSGAICQNMNRLDLSSCSQNLISTDCNLVKQCQVGCCYDANQGYCSLNSPKQACMSGGGNWSNSASCSIPQCQVGCCILGDQASITTPRECSRLSSEMNFQINFMGLDNDGTCTSHTNLNNKGACLTPSTDYSGKNDCRYISRQACGAGDFIEGYLCTSHELNTNCEPAGNTTCVDGRDEVFFRDSCGNIANIYDASKINNQSYWERPVNATCSSGVNCGKCDYAQGSVCHAVRQGIDARPTYGNNICRDLSCANGKNHGESWCVYDFNPNSGVSPVGSRQFLAKCIEGQVSMEPCADFNQGICVQSTGNNTEARCIMNDWRTCLAVNDKPSYSEIKTQCDENPQCIMFNELVGENNVKRSDGEYLAPFNPDIPTSKLGASGQVGADMNNLTALCVPRFTPGFVFWNTNNASRSSSSSTSSSSGQVASQGNNYGGSLGETNAICSLGSFSCVSKMQRKCTMGGSDFLSRNLCLSSYGFSGLILDSDCENWEDVDNWECNIDGVTTTIKSKDLPKLLDMMNERCRSLGSCGVSSNIAGEVNKAKGFKLTRVLLDAKGKTKNATIIGYNLSSDYLSEISRSTEKISSLSQVPGEGEDSSLEAGDADSGQSLSSGNSARGPININSILGNAELGQSGLSDYSSRMQITTGALGIAGAYVWSNAGAIASNIVGWLGNMGYIPTAGLGEGISTGLSYAAGAAIGAVVGYYLGTMIVKNQNWSPGHQKEFMEGITAGGAFLGTAVAILIVGCSYILTCVGALVITALYSFYENCIDNTYKENQYYVLTYTCEAWQPPTSGDCSVCNNDVRPCSEYRCRSLGSNCKYFIENGEPGYCATLNDIWSARISPWQQAISNGSKYTNLGDNGFKITSTSNAGVDAWNNLQFGIITDKPATCKLDTRHTQSYDEMQFEMEAFALADDINSCYSEESTCNNVGSGFYHRIVLSPHVIFNSTSSSTPGMAPNSENNYYIRCRNFAGQVNEAEFAVKVLVGEGEDLSPPIINRFFPVSGSYLAVGENSRSIVAYVNEPSECRYSQGVNNNYEDMTGNLSCITNPESGVMGEWPCFTNLHNLSVGENNIYFSCKDQPNIEERISSRRNINRNSKDYKINVCSTGLSITSLSPENQIITGRSPVSVTIQVQTQGCIANGKSTCSYKFENSSYIDFFETNANVHEQTFTGIISGQHNISILCEDEAGNSAISSLLLDTYLDNDVPIVTRSYESAGKLVILTNEDSLCRYTSNTSLGCGFDFLNDNSTLMDGQGMFHSATWTRNLNYYIKCSDNYNNTDALCGIVVKTY